MGYIFSTNKNSLTRPLAIKHNPAVFYTQTIEHFQKRPGVFLEGYLRHDKSSIKENKIKDLIKNWPLPLKFSGSYSFSAITENAVVLANDCIGVYPLYYYIQNNTFTASNSLLDLQKALNLDIDEVGKTERLFAPEQSEIGSRTLLKDVKRLLPGEKITYDLSTKKFEKSYDNRLYANMHNNINSTQIQKYWQQLRDEIQFIESQNQTSTDIALSGGLDSRILIGAMAANQKSVAYHYGKTDYYETKIAKQTAKACGFQFQNRMDYDNQFPEKEILQNTIQKVGPPYSMNWYNIFEMAKSYKTNLILGDMCEALHGRNIKAFSTRQSRIKNYFKHYVLNKDYKFTPATEKNFEHWKKSKLESYWNYIHNDSLLCETKCNIQTFKDQIDQDLEEIFKRIADHQLPFAELYEELFTWFTHSRIPMGRQITHCNERFYAYAPAMSTGLMIASSNIHPNLRLNYRFKNKLFKQIKALKPLNRIPISQVPYLSRQSPDFLQFLVWGIRSQTDQILIKRMLKYKKPHLRYRLFKSLNWVEVYQSEVMEDRLKSYFINTSLQENIINACIDLALARKELIEWPLTNYDIMSICILNLELKLILNEK